PAHPLARETAQHYWAALQRRSPSPHIHRLLRYIPERLQHHVRWEAALEQTSVPISFMWGIRDPVSGRAMADRIRDRLPAADFVSLAEAGHYPQLEVPDQVLRALRAVL